MIVAGFGFRGGATVESLEDALTRACGDLRPSALASVADKTRVPAFRRLAERLSLPVHAVSQDILSAQSTLTRSAAAQDARTTGSVAEAAALAAAGPCARLLGPRVISGDRMATCALAKGDPA